MALDNDLWLYLPFTKVDEEMRTVTGIAIGDNLDKQGDIVKFDATEKAFSEWEGNIREMHMPKAVGKAISHRAVKVMHEGEEYNGMEVTVYVSKGAQDTWEKVLDKTLKGFSIGGNIRKSKKSFMKAFRKIVRRVEDYALHELSLVDNPANPMSKITMVKQVDEDTFVYDANEGLSGTLFYCEKDGLAELETETCPSCGDNMDEIGFVDNFELEIVEKMIDNYTKGGPMDTENTEELLKNTDSDNITDMDENTSFLKAISDTFKSATSGSTLNVVYPPTYDTTGGQVYDNVTTGGYFTTTTGTSGTEADSTDEVEKVDTTEASEKTSEDTEEEVEKTEGGDSEVNMDDLSALLDEKLATQQEAILKTVDERLEKAAEVVTEPAEEEISEEESEETVEKSTDTTTEDVDVNSLLARIEELEAGKAIKKSVDETDEEDDDELQKNTESFWSNIFVDQTVIEGLGYTS
jgi:hypothetical protein